MISTTETLNYLTAGLKIYGKTIHPNCLAYEWMSGDNFEELADRYKIDDYQNFRSEPGSYFGKVIKDYRPIRTDWCTGDNCIKIKIASSISDCSQTFVNKSSDQTTIEFEDLSYSVLDREIENCSTLSPYLQNPVTNCYLVTIGEQTGGSIGTYYRYGIYGVTDLPFLGESIIPLRFFDTFNDALNFLEKDF